MKNNTKSSITLPRNEHAIMVSLMKKLGAKSKVEVIRRGLMLLKEQLEADLLREQFRNASLLVRDKNKIDYEELDLLTGEGMADED
ncbi:MAG: hypothetical protein GYA55_04705 [SAR324 cluster bacterium]|uniref:Uncharacterized protein n=1 Tax=SAR324 cluster bacterium TaxID=2024889 RepID=A0A7X9FQL1_9DELT|nr:hypothetical protein [SAR324 cluster bacterium]